MDSIGSLADAAAQQLAANWLPVQLGLIVAAHATSVALAAIMRRKIDVGEFAGDWPVLLQQFLHNVADNVTAIIFLALVSSLRIVMQAVMAPERSSLLAVAAKLAAAWVLIALLAGLIRNRFLYRVAAVSAWTIAALSILGLLGPVSSALDSVALVIGGMRLTPLLALKTSVLLLFTIWAAVTISDFLDRRVQSAADLTPSIQVLIAKLIRFSLITLSILIVVSSVGIDLSALALFSGAVGVGIGFGLQKIVSNLVSGIILLADKSIKPGDVISIGESLGWVVTMGARYTSVTTRDGREILIPNEDLVTQRVVNWSYSKDDIRLELKFSVDVMNDPHKVQRVALEAVSTVSRALKSPPPACHFMDASARSLDFSLRFWINDPIEGSTNIKSAVLFALWDAFKREGIAFPSPVQDMRLRDSAPVVVKQHGGETS